jgi:hypothetical protein
VVSQLCVQAYEEKNPKTANINCPKKGIVTAVVFASYGLPTGKCGSFAKDGCHAGSSQKVVEDACLGKETCAIKADNATFGDPCAGKDKFLFIEVECTEPAP